MVDSSFYGDTPNYATDYPTQNDGNTNPVAGNTAAPSSFYPNGGIYVELANSDDVLAAVASSATAAQAAQAAAAASAAAAAASLAAMTPSSATPLIDGTAAPGVSTNYARGDHVHPTDTSRAPTVSPAFTGLPAINNVGQGLLLIGNGVTTPTKYVRANSGLFQVVNDANTVAILNLTDAGDLSWVGAAWTVYTPTVTVTGGGAGTGAGHYKVLGKTVAITVNVNITTGGTSCIFSLPPGLTSGPSYYFLAGREQSVNGSMYNAQMFPSATACTLIRYDNGFPVTAGLSIAVSGTFEIV